MGLADDTLDVARTVTAQVEPGVTPGTWTVTFRSQAVPGTLTAFAGTLAVARLDIISATVRVSEEGTVSDTFDVVPLKGATLGPDDGDRLAAVAAAVLNGESDLTADLCELRSLFPSRDVVAPLVETHTDSSITTGIKVIAADRPGLLHDIAATLTAHGLRTRSLVAVTFTGRAYDTFRVVDSAGETPTDAVLLETLREELELASEG